MLSAYTKMNGLKNDFIVFKGPLEITSAQVAELCDRETGIGADGVLVVSNTTGSIEMQYWNADGSLAEMCGNGLRCAARFAVDNDLIRDSEFAISTPVGPLKVIVQQDGGVEAQIGQVSIEDTPLTLEELAFYGASVGNPHAITFVDDVENAPVESLGPIIENDEHFPNRTNVEFVQVVNDSTLKLRVWERGVGETLACGTGIVASAILASKQGKISLPASVEVRGGTASVWVDDEGYARLKGAVETTDRSSIELLVDTR